MFSRSMVLWVDEMIVVCGCDCREYPEDAYKEGEDLLTDDFARACKTCGRIITPDEFTDIIEEHDYAGNKN